MKRWLPDEIDRLRSMREAGKTILDIAIVLERSIPSVEAATKRILVENQNLGRKQWTEDEQDLLLRSFAGGLRGNDLLALFPLRTRGAVYDQIKSLRLRIARGERKSPVMVVKPEIQEPDVADGSTGPPLWVAPPPMKWAPPVITPASRCQYPLWPSHAPVPRPAPICGAPSHKRSLCLEHFLLCYERLPHETKVLVCHSDDAAA